MKKITIVMSLILASSLLFTACKGTETPASSAPTTEVTETTQKETTMETTVETTIPETTAAKVTASGTLSEDKYSFQVQINGELYQFPMTYADFTAKGWEYKNDPEASVDSMNYGVAERFALDGIECYADIVNLDPNAQPVKQCLIGGVSIDAFNLGKKVSDTQIILPGNITYGVSTIEEAKEKYGTPNDEYKFDDGSIKILYEKDRYSIVELRFDTNNKLEKVTVRNLVPLAAPAPAVEVSGDVPASVSAYKSPTAASDKFEDWIVNYGGVLYKLPTPVSEFEKNGWQVDATDSDAALNGKGNGWVTLIKDNQKLRVMAENYSPNQVSISNAFVCTVLSDPYDCKVPLVVAKGITTGMKEADLKKALEGTTVEQEESSGIKYYYVKPTSDSLNYYEFLVDKGTGELYQIEVDYAPSYKDFVK